MNNNYMGFAYNPFANNKPLTSEQIELEKARIIQDQQQLKLNTYLALQQKGIIPKSNSMDFKHPELIEPIEEVKKWHGIIINNTQKLPMPTDTEILKNKKYCAKEYAGLMTISNNGIYETHRYLYKNKFNTAELAKDLGIGRVTLERNIKKLENLDCKVLSIENTKNGIVYKLHYGKYQEDTGKLNKYTTIYQPMLKTLACAFNSNAIKLYCLLSYMTNETEFKPMDNKWLAEQIGLSPKSKNNLDTITEIVAQLELCGFIETKKLNVFKWDEKQGKEVPQITKQYRLSTLEEWKSVQNKVK